MASRREEHQEDAKFRVLSIIRSNPHITSCQLAKKVGISDGSAYYLLTSLIDKGFLSFHILEKHLKEQNILIY
jgi:DNA-binding IclR family transcriptional regulator